MLGNFWGWGRNTGEAKTQVMEQQQWTKQTQLRVSPQSIWGPSYISCTAEYLNRHMHVSASSLADSHLHLRHWADTLIKTGSWRLSRQVFHSATCLETVDGHLCRCRNQSCGFLQSFLATVPASCQQRLNCSTAAPCSRRSPARFPFIVPSIFNKEWTGSWWEDLPLQAVAVSTDNVNYVYDSEAECII